MTRPLDNSNGPQMNANEREFAIARHSGAGRNPFSGMTKINMDPGFRRDDGMNGVAA
ncbi:MAG: hypothetical protein V4567_13270 [Pseudomonadota bacterium]